MGNSCCCSGDKEAKLRRAEENKRTDEEKKRAAVSDSRYREEIDPRGKIDELQRAANRYKENAKVMQGQISHMYDQIKALLDKKGVHDEENANDLAREIVRKEDQLKQLHLHKQYCEKLTHELEMNQLTSELKNTVAKASKFLEKGLIDGEGLPDELYRNQVLTENLGDRRRAIHGQLDDRGDDHRVAEVLRKARDGK